MILFDVALFVQKKKKKKKKNTIQAGGRVTLNEVMACRSRKR